MNCKMAVVCLLFLSSCLPKRGDQDALKASGEASPLQTAIDGTSEFRSILRACIGDDSALRDVVYGPPPGFFDIPLSGNGLASLERRGAMLRSTTAADLQQAGIRTPTKPDDCLPHSTSPFTIVLVPGVFGEFIKTRAFEDLFQSADSTTTGRRWAAAIERLSTENPGFLQARSYIANLRISDFPERAVEESDLLLAERIDQVLAVASIDDENGRPLANVILLHSPANSSETLGKNADIAQIYNDRIDRYFKIMGVPKSIALMGYSRGTPLGLEMLVQAEKDYSWFSRIKAMVGLGGVIFGTDLADAAFPQPTDRREIETREHSDLGRNQSPTQQQIAAVQELQEKLQPLDGMSLLQSVTAVRSNTAAYGRFLKKIAGISGSPNSDPTELLRRFRTVDVRSAALIILKFASDNVSISVNPKRIRHFRRHYSNDIRKFKRFLKNVIAAIHELSTQSRIDWFKKHRLPNTVKYYSLAATMAPGELGRNNYAYRPNAFDFQFLVQGWRDYTAVSEIALNDSQVALHKAIFWPDIIKQLNPNAPVIRARLLAILGSHHWGLALRKVSNRESSFNPFPRMAVLKAIAHQLAKDNRN